MKTTMKHILGGAALGLTLLVDAGQIWAGQKISTEIRVKNTEAYGTMNGARYSKDDVQKIGCAAGKNPNFSAGAFAFCYATEKDGDTLLCATTVPNMVRAVSAITDSSSISFTTANGSGQCLTLDVDNSSAYLK